MNYNALYPSKYVAASDLGGQDYTVVIARVTVEKVGTEEEDRGVVYFVGCTKGMVLNRTNGKRIAALYGPETDAWVGRAITLYPSETEFGGDTVPCIRVRQQAPVGQAVQPPPPAAPPPPPAPVVPPQAVAAGNGPGRARF